MVFFGLDDHEVPGAHGYLLTIHHYEACTLVDEEALLMGCMFVGVGLRSSWNFRHPHTQNLRPVVPRV